MSQPSGGSIKTRLLFIMIAAFAGMALIAGFALQAEKSTLMDDRKVKTRHLVEAAHGILVFYHNRFKSGAMPEEEAKKAALDSINAMRYEKSEYFWVNDMQAKMIMHPKGELIGKDMAGNKDPNGKLFMMEFVNTVNKSGEGFVDYMWPKPGADKPLPKISYVKGFSPWGWLIGSGIYVDDVDAIFWSQAAWTIGIILVIAVLIGIYMVVVTRGIVNPLKELEAAMSTIQSTNDLAMRVKVSSSDEVGRMGTSFNNMIASFQDIIRQVIDNTRGVTGASTRLTASSQRVATSSQNQSEATTSMAAAVEEMTVTIDHIAESSQHTHSTARQAGDLSSQGSGVVRSAAEEMGKIADSVTQSSQFIAELGKHSEQISAIVNVIKEIADQTNLLALNAAIEAARAGEQGRGFAVVADEVRKLAERTSQSTQEITAMIDSIQSGTQNAVSSMKQGSDRVSEGVAMANRAGQSMEQIRNGANQVIAAVSDISSALREQSTASSQVAQNVERIAHMTEENSVAAMEIATQAEQLENLAGALESAVSRFKV